MHSPFTSENQEPVQAPPAPIIAQSQNGQDKAARTESRAVPPRKRQKIDLACEECRSRKVRCDGLRPECSTCKRREKACIYLPESSKLAGSRRVLHSLQDRLACLDAKANGELAPEALVENPESSTRLEERLSKPSSQMVNAVSSPSHSQQCVTDSIVVKPQQTMPRSSTALSATSSSEDAITDIDSLSPEQDLGAISAMGMALPATEISTDAAKEFYGKPSAASLLGDILNQGQGPSKQDSAPQLSPISSRSSLSVPYSSNADDCHLPPRHVADSLLEIYRERVQIIYPFLHWRTLMEAYNRLWLSETEIKSMPHLTGCGLGGSDCPMPVFYCALNAAFALATQFTEGSAHDRKERSTPFLRRSRHLMRLEFLDTAHIALVQALLILARYLQSTNLPSRCWNVAGIAYRMAQSLGLHITVNGKNTSELELEVRRRVWHSCVSLDTVLGMLTGRPISNSTASTVPLPSVPDEKFSTHSPVSCQRSENNFPTASFFAEAIKLSHILNRILGHVYDPWKKYEGSDRTELHEGNRYREQVSITMAFDDELDRFEIELPEVLQWPTETSHVYTRDILAQQRHVLRTRLLHIRLLLYRPVLVQFCQRDTRATRCSVEKPRTSSGTPSQLYKAFTEKCSAACIDIAQTLIDHIGNVSRTTYPGSPWYSCYYIYHAAIVVMLADTHCSQLQQLNYSNLRESWRVCKSFFGRISERNPDTYRYFRRLESLSSFEKPPYLTSSLTPTCSASCSASGGESTVFDPAEGTNDMGRSDFQTIEEIIENHIAGSYPDPSMSLGSANAWFAVSAQPENMELEPSLSEDQLWTLTEFCIMDAGSRPI